jgi:hypothetical protein
MKRTAAVLALATVLATGCDTREPLVEGVDLRVLDVEIPDATGLAKGASVPITVAVKNCGTEEAATRVAGQKIDVVLEFFTKSAADASEIEISAAMPDLTWEVASLAPGATVTLTKSPIVNLLADAALPAIVFCRATIDANYEVDEVNIGNNEALAAFQVLSSGSVPGGGGSVDLTVSSISHPSEIIINAEATITVVVSNPSSRGITAPFMVAFEAYDNAEHAGSPLQTVDTWTVVSLASGSTASHAFTFTPGPALEDSTVYYLVTADYDDVIVESSEGNNTRTGSSDIVGIPKPNLRTTVVSCTEHLDIMTALATINVTFSVENNGTVVAPMTVARIWISTQATAEAIYKVGTQEWNVNVPTLAPGDPAFEGAKAIDPNEALLEPNEYYYVIVEADGSKVVDEVAEGDNKNHDFFLTVIP